MRDSPQRSLGRLQAAYGTSASKRDPEREESPDESDSGGETDAPTEDEGEVTDREHFDESDSDKAWAEAVATRIRAAMTAPMLAANIHAGALLDRTTNAGTKRKTIAKTP